MAAVLASTPPPSAHRPPPTTPLFPSHPSLSFFTRPLRTTSPLHASPPSSTTTTTNNNNNSWSFEQCMQESLSVLDLMNSNSIPPDPALFCSLLKACSDEGSLHFGRTIHRRVVQAKLHHDPFVANSLISMYAKCGDISLARRLFDELPVKNVVSWTTAISMYHHAGLPHDALNLYRSMRAANVTPNAFTYTITLSSCSKVGNLELGVEVHEEVKRDGCEDDEFVMAALVDMYAKCGCVREAYEVFDRARNPTVVACTAMIEGLNLNGEGKVAMEVFRRIVRSGPNITVLRELGLVGVIKACVVEMAIRQGQEIHGHIIKFGLDPGVKAMSYLVELYEKCDRMETAYRLFDGLRVRSGGLWCRMVVGFARNGLYREALNVYEEMVYGDVKSSPLAISCALQSCGKQLSVEEGRQIHGRAIKISNTSAEEYVLGALLEMYNACEEHEAAHHVAQYRMR